MLPITFLDDPDLRLSKTAVGIFALALLTAGLACTVLLAFAVRSPLFQCTTLYPPALASSAVGLLTVFYNFLISSRYIWNTPAYLVVAGATLSTLLYAALWLGTRRKISHLRARSKHSSRVSQLQQRPSTAHLSPGVETNSSSWAAPSPTSSQPPLYQDPGYYENYIQNMFPASSRTPPQPAEGYDPSSITEEETQRQQMLQLLLQQQNPSPSPDPSLGGTYHIDWQGRDDEDAVQSAHPVQGYYAPQPQQTMEAISRHLSGQRVVPWDGVWRSAGPVQRSSRSRSGIKGQLGPGATTAKREERRREIERGG